MNELFFLDYSITNIPYTLHVVFNCTVLSMCDNFMKHIMKSIKERTVNQRYKQIFGHWHKIFNDVRHIKQVWLREKRKYWKERKRQVYRGWSRWSLTVKVRVKGRARGKKLCTLSSYKGLKLSSSITVTSSQIKRCFWLLKILNTFIK